MNCRAAIAFTLLLGFSRFATASTETIEIPNDWNPALAGDVVMEGLVTVTAPQVKGAHDAEMTIVGDRAYIVAEVDDEASGESAARASIYSTLSVVRLDPVELIEVIPLARGEQQFKNETLPIGACFVPRIIQKDADTLRCYFASERPGERQSQTRYRDFDIGRQEFAPTIHRAKLRTRAGIFPMKPQHFHADAVDQGFTKPAKDFGFYLFDSFKQFDGETYGALVSNPFPKQPKERREPYVTTTVKKGERFRLRYTVLIHEVDSANFDPAALAEAVSETIR